MLLEDNMRILFSSQEISQRIMEITKEIDDCYQHNDAEKSSPDYKKPVALCVLKGAAFFFTDLMKELHTDFEIDFIKISSYGSASTSSGKIELVHDTYIDVKGRDVLIVEDIVDSGNSMAYLSAELKKRGAKSVRIATLVDKHERREQNIVIDFAAFTLQQGFIVGYGMDYAEKYRSLPAVYEIMI